MEPEGRAELRDQAELGLQAGGHRASRLGWLDATYVILAEQNDEWTVCGSYMILETLGQISHPDAVPLTIAAR